MTVFFLNFYIITSVGFMIHRFGLEWDHELEEGIFSSLRNDSIVEIIPENFFDDRFSETLERLSAANVPVSVHGVLLSIGTIEELNTAHLDRVLEIAQKVPMVSLSEHLALTRVGEMDLDALTPLAWERSVADVVCKKIDTIQQRIQVPFYIENVANRFMVPGSEWSETEFINYITRKTGCGLLLDLYNVHVNAANFKFDPYEWIDSLDMPSVKVIHLAGGYEDPDKFLMDSHDNEVPDRAWELFRYVVERAGPLDTIIERTSNFPEFQSLEDELDHARSIVAEVYRDNSRVSEPNQESTRV